VLPVPLSASEKQRRYRERKRAEEEARQRYDRGLPQRSPEPEAPEGAYPTSNGFTRTKYGHDEALDGSFPPIPDGMKAEIFTTPDGEVSPIPEQHAKYLARKREGEDHSSLDALFQE
jgi:hypothetical protein